MDIVQDRVRPQEGKPAMSARILIVEDEEPLTLLLRYNLEAEGYEVETSARGDEAEIKLKESPPDLLVLDWMLPGMSGIELCRRLRARPDTERLPIIMLTARGEESERVRGLATGADDYIVKPFSVPELLARIRSLLRRARPERVASVLGAGDLELDREKKRVSRSGREVHLGPTEFRLLEFLMESPGRVYTREQLLDGVWGRDIYIDERTVDVHVGRLRRALNRGRAADPDPHRARRRLFVRRAVRQVGVGPSSCPATRLRQKASTGSGPSSPKHQRRRKAGHPVNTGGAHADDFASTGSSAFADDDDGVFGALSNQKGRHLRRPVCYAREDTRLRMI